MRGRPSGWHPARGHAIAGLAAVAVALAGCGDGEGSGSDAKTSTQARTQTSASRSVTVRRGPAKQEIPAAVADDVAKVRKALDAAGFDVKTSPFPGRAAAQLEVGRTLVMFFRNPDEAARGAASIKRVLPGSSGRLAVRSSGKRLYVLGQRDLSGGERSRFDKLVSTAEAAL